MASNYRTDYNTGGYPAQGYNNSYGDTSDSASSNNHYYGPSSGYVGSAPPAYSSQQHLVDPNTTTAATAAAGGSTTNNTRPSPFETVFDDHMYPVDSRQGRGHSPQNAGYYGAGAGTGRRRPSDDSLQPNDDIPLRDRNAKDAASPEDHIYDIPQGESASSTRGHKRPVRFGQLGMFGSDRKRIPFVVYLFSLVQIGVFVGELIKNGILTGTPIMIKPQFNPMIGPSPYVMINMGSRYVPCMHNVEGVQSSTVEIFWRCPNSTNDDSADSRNRCTLSDLCGFGGVPNPKYDGDKDQKPEPNQWYRFIIPMFMHSGIIHIGFNLLLQLTLARDMEQAIGSIRFFLVYVSSGIFGFVMGANYAGTAVSSTGASGSLFGIIALTLLDLLYSWRDRRNPVKDLVFILLDIVISFVLGLLPGLDNFSHIGGFVMGLALGISVLHSPNALRRRIGEDASYASVNATYSAAKPLPFLRSPIGFFKGRKGLWWAWWLLRAGAIVAVIIGFILLLQNFYVHHNTCSWCKYMSCLPIKNWCEVGNLQISNVTSKRDVFSGAHLAAYL